MICSIQRLRVEIGQNTLFDLSATNLEGQCCVFYGPSGVGKSTFLENLNHGNSHIKDSVMGSSHVSKQLRFNPAIHSVYYVPQHLPRFNLTVGSFFKYIHIHVGDGDCANRLNNIIVEFGLEDILDRHMNHVSGGQLQRIHLACALSSSANLLLLDEPSATLDKANKDILIRLLDQYIEQKHGFVICTTHDPNFAEKSTLDPRWHALGFPTCLPLKSIM